MSSAVLEKFHPVVRSWFVRTFGEPSPPQAFGWPSIAEGNHTLIVAPTGSGKTLAAFLWCINHLVEHNIAAGPPVAGDPLAVRRSPAGAADGVRILYISPLKALNNDIHRNLEIPLNGIFAECERNNIPVREIRRAVRTGDTTQSERAKMLKHPPDILITTPESLFLMLSSERSRAMFRTVQYVIVDEIHSLSNSKRGVHLSLSLERLEELRRTHRETADPDRFGGSFVRIGLSATQKPLETVAHFLGGSDGNGEHWVPRPVTIVDAGFKKNTDMKVICAARDFSDMPQESIWSLIIPQLIDLIREHRTTLIFVNNRRLAERIAARVNEILQGSGDMTNNYAVPFYDRRRFPETSSGTPPGTGTADLSVYAYHGSMSRTVREQLESDLKQGKLRALITTSALELGIDIGTVDLVVQIQSPKGIARGLQRVGRSGHLVDAHSKGRLFVTHKEDLIESAVVAKGMLEHSIERTFVPENCLDVLAQQIVAMVGIEEWNADELYDVVRRSYCFRSLSESIFHSVLSMLAGRYTSDSFRELRARIVWNKLQNILSPLPGSSLLALTNAGTIPDRGYFGVYLEDQRTKVGEVDEEFIYESRGGDTFILGSNVWRIMEIDANKVIVSPAPGQPARMPFWRGEGLGRTYELGLRIGEFLERLSGNGDPEHQRDVPAPKDDAPTRSIIPTDTNDRPAAGETRNEKISFLNTFPVDSNSSRNILEYISEQREATQIVPTHRTMVVEGFRDEVGDPRIVVHSCFGKSINGLLGIVLLSVLRRRMSIDIQMLYNDDGILFRCSDAERLPLDLFSGLTLHDAQQIILEEIPSSPLFGALFRQNAERSLLLPKGNPGKRRPFFLQRLKSADLLQIVRQFNDFPIVIETIRECLNDVLDFGHFKEIIAKIETGEITIHTVHNDVPSPFASTLLFDFASVYMYQWDEPKESSRQQFALLNRELLAEVVSLESISNVIRRPAVEKVEDQLQFTAATKRARTPEEMMEVMLRLGELSAEELEERSAEPGISRLLQEKGIITPVTIGGKQFFVLAEELPLYGSIAVVDRERAASVAEQLSGRMFGREESLRYVILRTIKSHGAVTAAEIAARFAIPELECETILRSIPASENILHGVFFEGSGTEQWCYRPNLERIHRASISLLRKEISPATIFHFTRLLMQWQHRHPQWMLEGEQGAITVLEQFTGCAVPAEVWEKEVIAPRLKRYEPSLLRKPVQRGEILPIGAPAGRAVWIFRGDGDSFLRDPESTVDRWTPAAKEILTVLRENGASLLTELREHTSLSLAAINRGLSELFWNGMITNDALDEILQVKRYRGTESNFPDERIEIVNARRNPFRSTAMRRVREALKETPGWHGRWSLVRRSSILGPALSEEEKIRRQAEQLLLRYGVVAREMAKREENLLPWPMIAMELQRMEMRGEIRRGYFVEGLSGMQFALPDAVNMLGEIVRTAEKPGTPIVLPACDPANPYGSGIDLALSGGGILRCSRSAGNYLVIEQGIPTAYCENHGMRIFFGTDEAQSQRAVQAFVQFVRLTRPEKQEIIVEYCDGKRPSESSAANILRSAGFYRDKVQTMRLDLR